LQHKESKRVKTSFLVAESVAIAVADWCAQNYGQAPEVFRGFSFTPSAD
jgi:hypothetical protein